MTEEYIEAEGHKIRITKKSGEEIYCLKSGNYLVACTARSGPVFDAALSDLLGRISHIDDDRLKC